MSYLSCQNISFCSRPSYRKSLPSSMLFFISRRVAVCLVLLLSFFASSSVLSISTKQRLSPSLDTTVAPFNIILRLARDSLVLPSFSSQLDFSTNGLEIAPGVKSSLLFSY
eukprot:gb/GEZJ01004247.1/.p1 GENE.gb/GEZJ01004247.1/~~gb/GEZJ01004247.1/.p1  ORF type:complete len:111 (+),score=10.94 gb/GEZJ01004247.1/:641-973(+)